MAEVKPECTNPDCGCHEPEPPGPNAVLGLVLAVLVFLGAGLSVAHCQPRAVSMPGPNGESGVWLPDAIANEARDAYELIPTLEERIRLTDARLHLELASTADLRVRADAAEARSERLTAALGRSQVRARRRGWVALGSGVAGLLGGLFLALR